ncbi:hypothetical protein CWO90_33025, partial [Bradyrhizobium sp. Leo121]
MTKCAGSQADGVWAMPSARALLVASLLTEPPYGVSALRVTIAIASARKQLGLRELGAKSRWLFREPAAGRPRHHD